MIFYFHIIFEEQYPNYLFRAIRKQDMMYAISNLKDTPQYNQGATKWCTQVRTYDKSPNNRLVIRPKVLKSTETYFISCYTKYAMLTRSDTHMTSTFRGLRGEEAERVESVLDIQSLFFLLKKLGLVPWADIMLSQTIYYRQEIFLLPLVSDSEASL